MKKYGYVRITAAVPEVSIADPDANTDGALALFAEARELMTDILIFPELNITGYTCADLFHQNHLLKRAEEACSRYIEETRSYPMISVLGLPVHRHGLLFNSAVIVKEGRILGIVPKTYIPNSKEYYERRWFASADSAHFSSVPYCGREVPFGTDLIFKADNNENFTFAAEICEDLWSPLPPSTRSALGGAAILLNLSASNELVGKTEYRRQLVIQQSARCLTAYAYVSAGVKESTTDTVFGGHSLIAENGIVLKEDHSFNRESHLICADADINFLAHERMKSSTFNQAVSRETDAASFRTILFPGNRFRSTEDLIRPLQATPFVPGDETQRTARCREIFAIQSHGLATRLNFIGCRNVVLGLSGGLDSTLALLVVYQAFSQLGFHRQGIHCYTLPGFGTTARTLGNVEKLCKALGLPLETVDIRESCRLQLRDLDHSGEPADVAYENVQARQRTKFLMNKSNMLSAIVIGTGDLSELALGWCTYNGDHMSMYAVNTGVPKTLVRYLVDYAADIIPSEEAAAVLRDIIETPISPELLPPDDEGFIQQKTEEKVGPYELHDFFLYQSIRCGCPPAKVYQLAVRAFKGVYEGPTILRWLKEFYRRFFQQQFKRSCLPDGPKVGNIALSPRADWRMPSDASPRAWLKDLERIEEELKDV